MISHPKGLSDNLLEDLLLAGARGLHAATASTCAEVMPRYSCTPQYRRAALASLMSCARELLVRQAAKDLRHKPHLTSPSDVGTYLVQHFEGYDFEAFVVMFLDAQHRLIAIEEMFRGTLTQTSVYPREVVKRALAHGAGAVILSHNHPSGSLEPSRADEHLTQALKSALALVDVRVLDHVVVGASGHRSMAERGLI
ncbi:DNA repair protein RadC [Ideonella sp. 4Y16]|uniref:DNA repair protein RadC n=1 Tax=Ideonella aquatica TaxID=2824119 RepID=A0A940YWE6_9BURK|nr:DNA repair protein RadC [Ideonella alba]MBQ0960475.1 DNA repair protein RadC [Ideonella aquatica]